MGSYEITVKKQNYLLLVFYSKYCPLVELEQSLPLDKTCDRDVFWK